MVIEQTHSTNTLLKELIAKGQWPKDEKYIRANYQTAGRGQTGNGWESEPNKNLLCSVLIDLSQGPSAISPFYLNVAVSVALHRMLNQFVSENGLTIKWPNDLYYGDSKLAGILIENAILGSELKYAIAGIGLNVNQTEWHSDAPNPVSLKMLFRALTGEEKELDVAALMDALDKELEQVLTEPAERTWDYYKRHLYRREGFWPFVEREVSTEPTMNANSRQPIADSFLARIADVLPTGELVLIDDRHHQRTYHFKQVRYVV